MNAVDEGLALAFPCHELSYHPVCKQHELLNQPVSFCGDFLIHIHRAALLIHDNLHLRTLETDCATRESLLTEL